MRVNIKIIGVVSDAIIPLLGYFLWGWGLFFILLYYLLDLFMSESFMYVKSGAIYSKQGGQIGKSTPCFLVSTLLLFCTLLLVRVFVLKVHPELNIWKEIVSFWRYKDLGVEQGYLLIPLVIIISYQRYKREFLGRRMDESISMKRLWRFHLKNRLLLITLVGFICGVSFFIIFPDWIYLLFLLVATSAYQLLHRSVNLS
jgi:hypothetical protein